MEKKTIRVSKAAKTQEGPSLSVHKKIKPSASGQVLFREILSGFCTIQLEGGRVHCISFSRSLSLTCFFVSTAAYSADAFPYNFGDNRIDCRVFRGPSRATVWRANGAGRSVFGDSGGSWKTVVHCTLRCLSWGQLEGVSAPALTGNRFLDRWREGAVTPVYDFIRQNMPPARRQVESASIPNAEYIDIVSYILLMNGYRAGTNELTPDAADAVLLVGKNGPQPLPDGAQIVTVGCLTTGFSGGWILSNAAEPVRGRKETASSPSELAVSAKRNLGSLTFRLTDMEAVPDFDPETHRGNKVEAKGYLVRQPNAERISLTAMETLAVKCIP